LLAIASATEIRYNCFPNLYLNVTTE
jgi:hypothetical protein